MVNFYYLMETFAEWLLEEMRQKNMSQQSLAQKSGITPAQISRVISGQRGLGEKSLTAIAHALNISPVTVFRKAGLLPEGNENTNFEDWQHLLNQLMPEDVKNIISDLGKEKPAQDTLDQKISDLIALLRR